MSDGLDLEAAAHFQRAALLGVGHFHARDGHRLAGQARVHAAGDHPDLLAVGPQGVAAGRRLLAFEQHAEDLEALLALEPCMFQATAKLGLGRRHGEVQAQLPEGVAGRLVGEGVHLRVVVGEEQQVALHPQPVQRGEGAGDDAHGLAQLEDGVPDQRRVGGLAEDLVAALAGVAGARDHHRAAEQLGLQVVEVRQLADARHVLGEKIHRQRSLQRQVVQVVVEQHRHLAAQGRAHQHLVARAGAVHHHEGVGAGAVDHAVVDELAGLAEDGRVDRLARIQLGNVAAGGIFEQRFGVRADVVDLLQPGHVHQPRAGADRLVGVGQVGGLVGPGRAHAVPVFQLGAQGAVTFAQGGNAPGIGHVVLLGSFFRGTPEHPADARGVGVQAAAASGSNWLSQSTTSGR
ncbi:hypothetical protein D3C80_1129210 [compost metagenome]